MASLQRCHILQQPTSPRGGISFAAIIGGDQGAGAACAPSSNPTAAAEPTSPTPTPTPQSEAADDEEGTEGTRGPRRPTYSSHPRHVDAMGYSGGHPQGVSDGCCGEGGRGCDVPVSGGDDDVVEIYNPQDRVAYRCPRRIVAHFGARSGRNNASFNRLVMCAAYSAGMAAEEDGNAPHTYASSLRSLYCKDGARCTYTHVDAPLSTLEGDVVHVHYVYRDESVCQYERLSTAMAREQLLEEGAADDTTTTAEDGEQKSVPPAGPSLEAIEAMIAPKQLMVGACRRADVNGCDADYPIPMGHTLVPASRIIMTDGARSAFAGAVEGGAAAPRISHCAYYYYTQVCNKGASCKFIHVVSVDPSQERDSIRPATFRKRLQALGMEVPPSVASTCLSLSPASSSFTFSPFAGRGSSIMLTNSLRPTTASLTPHAQQLSLPFVTNHHEPFSGVHIGDMRDAFESSKRMHYVSHPADGSPSCGSLTTPSSGGNGTVWLMGGRGRPDPLASADDDSSSSSGPPRILRIPSTDVFEGGDRAATLVDGPLGTTRPMTRQGSVLSLGPSISARSLSPAATPMHARKPSMLAPLFIDSSPKLAEFGATNFHSTDMVGTRREEGSEYADGATMSRTAGGRSQQLSANSISIPLHARQPSKVPSNRYVHNPYAGASQEVSTLLDTSFFTAMGAQQHAEEVAAGV